MNARDDRVRQAALAWAKKAEEDLRTVQILAQADDCPFSAVGFHAQQAAEKYIKAVLTRLQIAFPKTHDLADLCGRLPGEETPQLTQEQCETLSRLAVTPRYPEYESPVTREEAEAAADLARRVRQWARDTLRARGVQLPS